MATLIKVACMYCKKPILKASDDGKVTIEDGPFSCSRKSCLKNHPKLSRDGTQFFGNSLDKKIIVRDKDGNFQKETG